MQSSLSVSVEGDGVVGGLVAGQDCSAACQVSFDSTAQVTLVANAGSDSTFGGWGGDCAGTSTVSCIVTMAANHTVTATFVAAPAPSGRAYYVSSGGSDSAVGTSVGAPLKTIGRAISLVAAGDVIEVRAGTYGENLYPRTAGTSGAWITLRGYNGERPVIRGTGSGPTIYFYRDECDEGVIGTGSGNTDCKAMYWTVQGLDIRGSASGDGDGNAVKIDTPKVKLVGNRICCSVADVVKLVRTANDVEILDNEISQDRSITVPSDNAQAVDIVGADRTRVAGNYVHDMTDFGIYAKGNSRNTVFENNLLVNIVGNALMLGQSTDADRLADGNYETYDGIIRNNVVVGSGWACLASSSSIRAKIYNNSCYNTGTSTHGSILLSNESEVSTPGLDIEIYNNIIYGSANKPILSITSNAMSDYKTLKMDKNIYYIGGGDPQFSSSDHFGQIGVAQWRTQYQSLSGRSDTSLVVDPKFAATTGSSALTLQSTSPAINAGTTNTTVVPMDRRGVARPQSGAADIGAYEY